MDYPSRLCGYVSESSKMAVDRRDTTSESSKMAIDATDTTDTTDIDSLNQYDFKTVFDRGTI